MNEVSSPVRTTELEGSHRGKGVTSEHRVVVGLAEGPCPSVHTPNTLEKTQRALLAFYRVTCASQLWVV